MYRTGMLGSWPFNADLMALDAWESLRRLHRNTGEHAMAGGEADTAADAGMAFWTSPIEAEPTRMIYRRARLRWKHYRGVVHARASVSWRRHGLWCLEVTDTAF